MRPARLLGPLLTALLAACGGPQNYLEGASPAARSIAHYGWFVLMLFSIAALLVWIVLAWIVFRRRGTLAEHAPVSSTDGISWVAIGGLVIPGIAFLVVF